MWYSGQILYILQLLFLYWKHVNADKQLQPALARHVKKICCLFTNFKHPNVLKRLIIEYFSLLCVSSVSVLKVRSCIVFVIN